jgi:filamentous hemagglutinin
LPKNRPNHSQQPYAKGSWLDKLTEAFSGTHDTIGGKLAGLYDEQGNIKRGMTEAEKTAHDIWSGTAVPISASFAIAELLSPEAWNAIATLIKIAK